jgi:hypothetical protein
MGHPAEQRCGCRARLDGMERAKQEEPSPRIARVSWGRIEVEGPLGKGIVPKTGYVHYTVRQAAEDWLAHGLDGRSAKTVKKNQNVLEPILNVIGARKLRELTAADVRKALSTMAAGFNGSDQRGRWPIHETFARPSR